MVAEGIEVAIVILPAFPQKNSNFVRLLCFGLGMTNMNTSTS